MAVMLMHCALTEMEALIVSVLLVIVAMERTVMVSLLHNTTMMHTYIRAVLKVCILHMFHT